MMYSADFLAFHNFALCNEQFFHVYETLETVRKKKIISNDDIVSSIVTDINYDFLRSFRIGKRRERQREIYLVSRELGGNKYHIRVYKRVNCAIASQAS